MRELFEKLNTPRAVIVVLAVCLAANGLLYYSYQSAFGITPTSVSSVVPAPDTEEGAGESNPEPGAGEADPKEGNAEARNPEEDNPEEGNAEETSRSTESGGGSVDSADEAGVPGGSMREGVPVSVAAWCAPGAISGEPTAVVLAASAGRWATAAAVQKVTEPVWRRVVAVTEPTWRWLVPRSEDDTAAPDAAPTGPSEAPVEDVPEATAETMPETAPESTTESTSTAPPQGSPGGEEDQYTDGESTSTAPQDSPSTTMQGAGGATSSVGETTSSTGGATSSTGGATSSAGGATSSAGGAMSSAGGATSSAGVQ